MSSNFSHRSKPGNWSWDTVAECWLSNGAAKVYSIDITQPGDEFQIMSKRFLGRLFLATADMTKEASI